MRRTFEENVEVTCDDNKSMVDLAWELKNAAESIAVEQLVIYWNEHSINDKLSVPLQPNGKPFKLGLLYGREFAFYNIVFDEEHAKLYFEGRFDEEVKDTVIYEEDLEPIHGILWLADYIINGVY